MPNLNQFIALGDSLTEGLSDKYPDGSYRGWADRVADEMSKHHQDFRYANLAVRGKLLEQVVTDQLQVALPWMQGSQTLVTFHAGANNVLRPKFEPGQVFETYRNAVAQISETGARLLLFTVREVSNWQDPMSPYKPAPAPSRVVGSAAWGIAFLVPWAIRRMTRKSSGDGRVAKHSELVTWSPRI